MARRRLFSDFIRMRLGRPPSDKADLPIVDKSQETVEKLIDASSLYSMSQLNQFRTIAEDRDSQYEIFDEMGTDSVIAAALEIYADDATAYDEQGRIIWVESDDEEIAKAGNRLLDILEIPERAWKHIYQACKYGDFYLKLYRKDSEDGGDQEDTHQQTVRIVNDKVEDPQSKKEYRPEFEEYVEDVDDPSTMFDLRKRGKVAGFVQVTKDEIATNQIKRVNKVYLMKDVDVYRPDRFVHIMIGEDMTRNPETMTLQFEDGSSETYGVAKGKSILYDVYPIQKELRLLEDALLLNRLTRSALIRLLEIEVGDMPKKEVNNYLRRVKNLIEQHISLDKDEGTYKSFNAPGPIDNVIYIPTKNGKGHIEINNLGGDVNVRDISDVDYFNNRRSGALKIPKQFLGEDGSGGLDSGGALTKLSARYARTIKRIQTAYIRAITTMLNLFFVDKKLDYVNKFKVRMTSPSTQDEIDRTEILGNNVELISSIMDLMSSLEGDTQKKILTDLLKTILKMPDIATMVEEDGTPEEEINIEGGGGPDISGGEGPDFTSPETVDMSSEFTSGEEESETPSGGEEGFSDEDYSSFEDEI